VVPIIESQVCGIHRGRDARKSRRSAQVKCSARAFTPIGRPAAIDQRLGVKSVADMPT
jgi:hypothetical protein